jgi:hypothetical protein
MQVPSFMSREPHGTAYHLQYEQPEHRRPLQLDEAGRDLALIQLQVRPQGKGTTIWCFRRWPESAVMKGDCKIVQALALEVGIAGAGVMGLLTALALRRVGGVKGPIHIFEARPSMHSTSKVGESYRSVDVIVDALACFRYQSLYYHPDPISPTPLPPRTPSESLTSVPGRRMTPQKETSACTPPACGGDLPQRAKGPPRH